MGPGRAVAGLGRAEPAICPWRTRGARQTPAVCIGDCAVPPLPAVVMEPERSGDPAIKEKLHERPLYRRFVGLDGATDLPNESTIVRFRHLLDEHQFVPQMLATINDGSPIKACCSKPAPRCTPPSLPRPARPRTTAVSVIPRCTRPDAALRHSNRSGQAARDACAVLSARSDPAQSFRAPGGRCFAVCGGDLIRWPQQVI